MRIAAFLPCSLIDYPGLISAVVFTQGCNWRCPWCHNKDLLSMEPRPGALEAPELLTRLEARRGKLDGVVVSGGEPSLQPGIQPFFHAIKELGFLTKLDTNGSNPSVLARLLAAKCLDFVAMDLKAPWERYEEAAGVRVDVSALRESLSLLRGSGLPYHLRTTRWPGLNPCDEVRILELCADSPHVWQDYLPPSHGGATASSVLKSAQVSIS